MAEKKRIHFLLLLFWIQIKLLLKNQWFHQFDDMKLIFCRSGWHQWIQRTRSKAPGLSAWSTSSCGPNVSTPNKLNLISKSFPLIPPEWTVNGTSIIYTDLSVRSCAWCSGAVLQQLRQRLGPCLRHQNWRERTSFDRDGPRKEERGDQTGLIWDTSKTNKDSRNGEVSL